MLSRNRLPLDSRLAIIGGVGALLGSQIVEVAGDLPLYQTTIEKKVDVLRKATLGRIADVASRFHGTLGQAGQISPPPASPAGEQAARALTAYTEQHDPEVSAAVELGGIRTFLAVPMMLKEDQLIGTLIVYRQEVRPFSDKQIELLANFAAQAVIAIENARLLNELRQRTAELTGRTADLTEALEQRTATSEVLEVISSSPGDLQPVFETMLDKAVHICDAGFGNIFRWDGEAIHLVATHGTPPAFAEARRDGVMVVFNDPVPVGNPALQAVLMACLISDKEHVLHALLNPAHGTPCT
jgi:hypothetical protein